MKNERGQTLLAAMLATLLLVALAAGGVELARLHSLRLWAYRAAESAAVAGAAQGRDYAAYIATGAVRLDPATALDAAEKSLLTALALKGLEAAAYDLRVHPTATAGAYPGYPPVPHAGMLPGDWTPAAPAVAVYLELRVRPILYGWINGHAAIPLRVFAAANVVIP